jgi:peptide chain release factor 2
MFRLAIPTLRSRFSSQKIIRAASGTSDAEQVFISHYQRVQEVVGILSENARCEGLHDVVMDLEHRLSDTTSAVWNDPVEAAKLSQDFHSKKASLDELHRLQEVLEEAKELNKLAQEESDECVKEESIHLLFGVEESCRLQLLRSALCQPMDAHDVFITILAGAGGDDAKQWAVMLAKAYIGWASHRGAAVRLLEGGVSGDSIKDKSEGMNLGDSASAMTLHITGGSSTTVIPGLNPGSSYLYGILRSEAGLHRLVRRSPFNGGKRQTSFAQVLVYPDVPSDVSTETLRPSDVTVQTYKSGGAGGQSVNTTDSAVRLIHNPTGTVVTCQNERSQHQNKAYAMRLLSAKLQQHWREEREQKMQESTAAAGGQADTSSSNGGSFGSSGNVRSYVLHPYQLVKDARSGYQTSDVDGLLSGNDAMAEMLEKSLVNNRKAE